MYNSGFKGSIGSAGHWLRGVRPGFASEAVFVYLKPAPKFDAATLPPRADESL